MSASSDITDVTSENFAQAVVGRSEQVPVLVDFWASWCAPCGMLTPILEDLVTAYDGKVALAKVNADEERELAQQFGIRGLPTVKVFRNGKVVDEFVGVHPPETIRAIVEPYVERESDKLRAEAHRLAETGKLADAVALLEKARAMDPERYGILVDLAALQVEQGDFDAAEVSLQQLPALAEQSAAAELIRARLQFARAAADAADETTLEALIKRESKDLESRYTLAAKRIIRGEYESGLEQLLEIMRQDRKFGDDLGHRSVLAVFSLLGDTGEVVERYRREIAKLLY